MRSKRLELFRRLNEMRHRDLANLVDRADAAWYSRELQEYRANKQCGPRPIRLGLYYFDELPGHHLVDAAMKLAGWTDQETRVNTHLFRGQFALDPLGRIVIDTNKIYWMGKMY